jgi:hypothetical protein
LIPIARRTFLKAVATHRIKCNSYWKFLIALASDSDSTESLKIERWENGREADLSEKQGKDRKRHQLAELEKLQMGERQRGGGRAPCVQRIQRIKKEISKKSLGVGGFKPPTIT